MGKSIHPTSQCRVFARSHARGQGESEKNPVPSSLRMLEKPFCLVGIQNTHFTSDGLRDRQATGRIRSHQSPTHSLFEGGMKNGIGVVDGSLRQPLFVHLVIDTLEIERCKASEFALSKHWANIETKQCLVIAVRLGSELRSGSKLEPAVKILVEGQSLSLKSSAPAPFLKSQVQVALCRPKPAADRSVQVLPPAGLPISAEGNAHQPPTRAASNDLSIFSGQSAFSWRVKGAILAHSELELRHDYWGFDSSATDDKSVRLARHKTPRWLTKTGHGVDLAPLMAQLSRESPRLSVPQQVPGTHALCSVTAHFGASYYLANDV